MTARSYVGSAEVPAQGKSTKGCAGQCGVTCDVEVIHADAVGRARAALPTATEAAELVGLFGAFANGTRLAILLALRSALGESRPELCVCDLVAITGASQSLVSHQLSTLRQLGLAMPRREGKLIYYRLATEGLARLLDDALALGRRKAP